MVVGNFDEALIIEPPQHMHEGNGSHSVCLYFLCVCVFVTELAVTYLICVLKFRCH